MNWKSLLSGAVLVVTSAAVTSQVVSQDHKHGDFGDMTPEEQKMMQKWMAYATPGEHHADLAKRVGEWTYVVKHRMAPDAEWERFEGEAEYRMVMGGRYLLERSKGEGWAGMPFEGMGLTGYDNVQKKYVWTWIDNGGTGIMTGELEAPAAGANVAEGFGVGTDPMAGKERRFRCVMRKLSGDRFSMEMHDETPDGTEFKNFEIVYTRAD